MDFSKIKGFGNPHESKAGNEKELACDSSVNFGYYFYKDYFDDETKEPKINLPKKHFEDKSSQFLNLPFDEGVLKPLLKTLLSKQNKQLSRIALQTTYPGLLIGSGYSHETGNEGEFKIGFFFDYSTGLPLIPGSSVKGILRSAFSEERREYVLSLLKGILRENHKEDEEYQKEIVDRISPDFISKLKMNIFEGRDGNCESISVYGRDIFFDAFTVGPDNNDNQDNNSKTIFSDDFITPHNSPLKNPIPIRFLKIKAKVKFVFLFRLHDALFEVNGLRINITAENKIKLFRKILLDLGVGAKTNVGYGFLR